MSTSSRSARPASDTRGWNRRSSGRGRDLTLRPKLQENLASSESGATIEAATGINQGSLLDDDENTQWAALGAPVDEQFVAVDLAGNKQTVRRVQVSAMLRPTIPSNPDNGSQSRVSALRQFEVLACSIGRGVDCDEADEFRRVFTSPEDAFPSTAPRPRAPDLIIRSFDIPRTQATHLWFQVVTNQCTGAPDYAGEQDNDDRAISDCTTGSPQAHERAGCGVPGVRRVVAQVEERASAGVST